jgi:hypothetical protein
MRRGVDRRYKHTTSRPQIEVSIEQYYYNSNTAKMLANSRKVLTIMNTLGKLEQLLLAGEINEEEYKKRKAFYVETILELYIKGIIDEAEMKEKLND